MRRHNTAAHHLFTNLLSSAANSSASPCRDDIVSAAKHQRASTSSSSCIVIAIVSASARAMHDESSSFSSSQHQHQHQQRFAKSQSVQSGGDFDEDEEVFASRSVMFLEQISDPLSSLLSSSSRPNDSSVSARNGSSRDNNSRMSPQQKKKATPRIFDPRRQEQYFDDLLLDSSGQNNNNTNNTSNDVGSAAVLLSKKKTTLLQQRIAQKKKQARQQLKATQQQRDDVPGEGLIADSELPTAEETERTSSCASKSKPHKHNQSHQQRPRRLVAISSSDVYADVDDHNFSSFLSPTSRASTTIENNNPEAQGQTSSSRDESLATTTTTTTTTTHAAAVLASRVLDLLKAELAANNKKNAEKQQQQEQQSASSISVQRLKDVCRSKLPELFTSSKSFGFLRFLRHHARQQQQQVNNNNAGPFFDVSGDGQRVGLFRSMTLEEKVPPPFVPHFKVDKSKEDKELFNVPKSEAEPEPWMCDLDLDTSEQAETNRVVQEAAEMERLEDLDETGRLDKLLGVHKMTPEQIFKSFASEVHMLTDAPAITQATSLESLSKMGLMPAYSSSSGAATSTSLSGKLTPPPLPGALRTAGGPAGGGGASSTTTPPAIGGGAVAAQKGGSSSSSSSNVYRPSVVASMQSNDAFVSSSSSSSSSSLLPAKTSEQMLDLFVDVVPTFFVPVLLLRVSDELHRASGKQDIGKVLRQHYHLFDFRSTRIAAGFANSSVHSADPDMWKYLRELQVKLKKPSSSGGGRIHPRAGAADKLYEGLVDSSSSSAVLNDGGGDGCFDGDDASSRPHRGASSPLLCNSSAVETPVVPPIRLATDLVDSECQEIMSALNEKDDDGQQEKHQFRADLEELVAILKRRRQEQQKSSSNNNASTSSSLIVNDAAELLQWIQARPRIFVALWNNKTDGRGCCWTIGLRPLDVAPGSVMEFSVPSFSSTPQEIKKMETILRGGSDQNGTSSITVSSFEDHQRDGEDKSDSDTSTHQRPTLDDISACYSKVRAGMWTDMAALRAKLPRNKWLERLDRSGSSNNNNNKPTRQLLSIEMLPPWCVAASISSPVSKLAWCAMFGKSLWVNNNNSLRRFKGSADLDDVEHFALRILHTQVKQMVSANNVDVKLADALRELPACCAHLFSKDEEAALRVLRAHPNLFAVSMKEKVPWVGLASLFRK